MCGTTRGKKTKLLSAFSFPQSGTDRKRRTEVEIIYSIMEMWRQIETVSGCQSHHSVSIYPGDFVLNGTQNYIVEAEFIGNQSKHRWCHTVVITWCNLHLSHHDKLLQKTVNWEFNTVLRSRSWVFSEWKNVFFRPSGFPIMGLNS